MQAQLTPGGGAGAEPLALRVAPLEALHTRVPARPVAYDDLPVVEPEAFDFSRTKPHLAFFCRLELDIEDATRFPVRFRLGEVRTWQQELTKRD
ncbi:hypothetical protein LEM8419_01155 [Neolewinella maritima]|uniref:DUF930 domain-containing protein n=1 Tax=Neolewinella maritima TaxID=1383882 RepID=A0ABN8F701_9BACT|nr:hypothetical protein LEM8419_01155 [Neolewinella maritima]